MPSSTAPTTIEINGFALREIRVRSGLEVQPLADQVEVTRSYLAKIELGHSVRVSPKVYVALLKALGIQDRRVLLADPHGTRVTEPVSA